MKIRKLFPVLLLAMLLASTAWADNIPEFDAVGVDSSNFFASNMITYKVVTAYWDDAAKNLEDFSNFVNVERFYGSAGQAFADACWGEFDSVFTPRVTPSYYEWLIVLQLQPESDINLNIYDCVLKPQGAANKGVFGDADQTGRFRGPAGKLYFVPTMNPSITAIAYPGPYAVPAWKGTSLSQTLEARMIPSLRKQVMDEVLYTSKAHWDEGIVIALPQTGNKDVKGKVQYELKQGDKIYVRIDVPQNSPVDLYYGADSVILKYVGVVGTTYFGTNGD